MTAKVSNEFSKDKSHKLTLCAMLSSPCLHELMPIATKDVLIFFRYVLVNFPAIILKAACWIFSLTSTSCCRLKSLSNNAKNWDLRLTFPLAEISRDLCLKRTSSISVDDSNILLEYPACSREIRLLIRVAAVSLFQPWWADFPTFVLSDGILHIKLISYFFTASKSLRFDVVAANVRSGRFPRLISIVEETTCIRKPCIWRFWYREGAVRVTTDLLRT